MNQQESTVQQILEQHEAVLTTLKKGRSSEIIQIIINEQYSHSLKFDYFA